MYDVSMHLKKKNQHPDFILKLYESIFQVPLPFMLLFPPFFITFLARFNDPTGG